MKFQPLNDRLLVQRLEEEERSTGGIIIPSSAKETPAQAKVIAVGQGKVDDSGKRIKPQVKKGDLILISKYGGTDVKIESNDHLIIREDDVLGIIEK